MAKRTSALTPTRRVQLVGSGRKPYVDKIEKEERETKDLC
jgi:hypothetical protein